MKVLITGFDPFGGEAMNPAYEAVKLLPNTIEGAEVIKVEVPTVFGKAIDVLEENMTKYQPDVVICVGQAGGRFGVTPERVAINQDDARIKDNEEINQLMKRFVLTVKVLISQHCQLKQW